MEQTVWLYVGIIAAVISLVILFQIFSLSNERARAQSVANSIGLLERHCNLVCDAPFETLLDVKITLPSGARLSTKEKTICIDYQQQPHCVQCNCDITEYELDLDTPEARELFDRHDYYCMFERRDFDVRLVECVG